MNQLVFSDEELRRASASVQQVLLDSLPTPAECEHEFSDAFYAKMKRIISRYDLHRKIRKTIQRAAVVFLAVLVSLSVWLSIDTQARDAFFSWVQEIYEEHIVYRFFGEPTAENLPLYRITWLPEGYEEIDVYNDGKIYNALYQKGDDVMSAFVLDYCFVQSGVLAVIKVNETDYTHKTINVHGMQADFYEAVNPDETNNLIWVNEKTGVVFTLNGFLDESVMLHIAESVVLADSTK